MGGKRKCKYPDCPHTAADRCGMKRFPSDRDKCLRWLRACGFADLPENIPVHVFLCLCHFREGNADPVPVVARQVSNKLY